MLRRFALAAAAAGITATMAFAGPASAAPGAVVWRYADWEFGFSADPEPYVCVDVTRGEGEVAVQVYNETYGDIEVFAWSADCSGPSEYVGSGLPSVGVAQSFWALPFADGDGDGDG